MYAELTFLVTGGTGSFGKTIIADLLSNALVKEVRVFSRDEEKQLDLKRQCQDERVQYILGDVRDYERINEACQGVNVVYHAAAQKIIDSCEEHPTEALKTNVLGTLNVKRACLVNKVKTAVLLSTDKAVKPINLYGMTKAMAERIWINGSHQTKFTVTRYGNVIGSRGSVIPYFKQLISEKQKLRLTDLEMTRFLLTLQQATHLVKYATWQGVNRCIYVPKIPSCRIADLAQAMAGPDYPITIVGVRPGEKIHECLIQEYEIPRTKLVDGVYQIHPTEPCQQQCLSHEYTSDTATLLTRTEIMELLEA